METKGPSLFDDAKAPKRHIVRNGVKVQRRMLLIVLGVMALGGVLVAALASRGDSAAAVAGWQSDTVKSGEWNDSLELTASVELKDSRALSVPERGTIQSLLVEEGDTVSRQQVLAKIAPADLPDELTKAKSSLASQERALEKSRTQFYYSQKQSEQSLKAARRDQADAQKALDLSGKLREMGSASEDELAAARAKLDSANEKIAQLELAAEQEAALNALNEKGALADLETLRATVADLEERIALCTVRSPIDGTVLQIAADAREQGLLLSQYAALITVGNTKASLLVAKLPESNASQVKKGMPVTITTDAGSFGGTVDRIGALALTDSSTYGTYLDLYVRPASGAPELRSGSAASLTLNLGKRSEVTMLRRGPWYSGATQNYVFVVQGSQAVKTKVTLGATTPTQVEIVSGLQAGDRVLTSSYQAIAAYQTVNLEGSGTSN